MTAKRSSESGALVRVGRAGPPAVRDPAVMREWAEELVARARDEGVELTGEGGMLTDLVRQVLQTGLEVELGEHLGYEPYDPAGRGSGDRKSTRLNSSHY